VGQIACRQRQLAYPHVHTLFLSHTNPHVPSPLSTVFSQNEKIFPNTQRLGATKTWCRAEESGSLAQPAPSTSNKTFTNATHQYCQHKNFIRDRPSFCLCYCKLCYLIFQRLPSLHVFVGQQMTGSPQMVVELY
jgi:hypothetical protein